MFKSISNRTIMKSVDNNFASYPDIEVSNTKRTVSIHRSVNDYHEAEVSTDDIFCVRWDNVSGGPRIKERGYSLYGDIPYKLAKELYNLPDRYNEDLLTMKVRIIEPDRDDPQWEGYQELLDEVYDKPEREPRRWVRLTGSNCPPCTKRILQLLVDGEKTRKELRDTLKQEGYTVERIRGALWRLYDGGMIAYSGYGSNSQIISSIVK